MPRSFCGGGNEPRVSVVDCAVRHSCGQRRLSCMDSIVVQGVGAVSPAGWTAEQLCAAVAANEPLPTKDLARPGWDRSLRVRSVPVAEGLPFALHARLRRASPVTQYGAGAALEALGSDVSRVQRG